MTQTMQTIEKPSSLRMTFDEFLEWAGEETFFAEWVDGEVQFRMPASLPHQSIVVFLCNLLNVFVNLQMRGKILVAPFLMRLPLRPSGREPDLLFVATENFVRLHRTYLDGAADLAIEIVSPEGIERDYIDKKAEYAQNGVREYWCIDPDRQTVLFCQLTNEGTYREVMLSEGRYDSTTIEGFWLQVEWLWQEPLPLKEAMTELQLFNLPNSNS